MDQPSSAHLSPPPAPHIARYRVLKSLGVGACGEVFACHDPVVDRLVAVKILRAQIPDDVRERYIERFSIEVRTLGRLSHRNVIGVYDAGLDQDRPYLAMELCGGPSLQKVMSLYPALPLGQAAWCVVQLLNALEVVHARNIVHRDIKPGNMLFHGEVLKLTDFGVAHVETSQLTMTGDMVGTPSYMSPEQVLGQKVDHRADLYSVGVILFQMLAGRRPFVGDAGHILYQVAHMPPPRFSSVVEGLPATLDAYFERALATAATDRFSSATEMRAALLEVIPESVHEAVPGLGEWVELLGLQAPPPATGSTFGAARISETSFNRRLEQGLQDSSPPGNPSDPTLYTPNGPLTGGPGQTSIGTMADGENLTLSPQLLSLTGGNTLYSSQSGSSPRPALTPAPGQPTAGGTTSEAGQASEVSPSQTASGSGRTVTPRATDGTPAGATDLAATGGQPMDRAASGGATRWVAGAIGIAALIGVGALWMRGAGPEIETSGQATSGQAAAPGAQSAGSAAGSIQVADASGTTTDTGVGTTGSARSSGNGAPAGTSDASPATGQTGEMGGSTAAGATGASGTTGTTGASGTTGTTGSASAAGTMTPSNPTGATTGSSSATGKQGGATGQGGGNGAAPGSSQASRNPGITTSTGLLLPVGSTATGSGASGSAAASGPAETPAAPALPPPTIRPRTAAAMAGQATSLEADIGSLSPGQRVVASWRQSGGWTQGPARDLGNGRYGIEVTPSAGRLEYRFEVLDASGARVVEATRELEVRAPDPKPAESRPEVTASTPAPEKKPERKPVAPPTSF